MTGKRQLTDTFVCECLSNKTKQNKLQQPTTSMGAWKLEQYSEEDTKSYVPPPHSPPPTSHAPAISLV
jgi:hypothetical protein